MARKLTPIFTVLALATLPRAYRPTSSTSTIMMGAGPDAWRF